MSRPEWEAGDRCVTGEEMLAPEVTQFILVQRNGGELVTLPYDGVQMRNWGGNPEDPVSVAQVHAGVGEIPLGVRREVRRQFELRLITDNAVTVYAKEDPPQVTTTWISWSNRSCAFLTREQARGVSTKKGTALDLAINANGGVVPMRVVRTGGQYYPAMLYDSVVETNLRVPKP